MSVSFRDLQPPAPRRQPLRRGQQHLGNRLQGLHEDRERGVGEADDPRERQLDLLHDRARPQGVDDADVTRALDSRAFYICPRINPDGAEWALADKPKWVRSSTRTYPYDEEAIEGLTVEDIDGDGRILQMRLVDMIVPNRSMTMKSMLLSFPMS